VLGMLRGKLKGEDRYETAENYCLHGIVIGTIMVAIGILTNVISTQGITAIIAMLGALLSFASTVGLIFVWLFKEFLKGD
jgi:hypothetical protein